MPFLVRERGGGHISERAYIQGGNLIHVAGDVFGTYRKAKYTRRRGFIESIHCVFMVLAIFFRFFFFFSSFFFFFSSFFFPGSPMETEDRTARGLELERPKFYTWTLVHITEQTLSNSDGCLRRKRRVALRIAGCRDCSSNMSQAKKEGGN